MTRKIVLASGNPGKLRELARVLAGLGIELMPQSEFEIPEADETGLTFIENALIKARHAAALSGLPAIADDSGLEVDYLNGAPGIYSARYAGVGATDESNVTKLLRDLEDVAPEARGARFRCSIVYLRDPRDATPIVCEGTWAGRILNAPVGGGGFGYDPVFEVPGYGCSAAELPPDAKDRLGHRGQALRALRSAFERADP